MLSFFKSRAFWLVLLTLQATLTFSASLFTVVPNSSGITITPTIPNHTYPTAGIRLNTPGHRLTQAGNECKMVSSGFCIFSVSQKSPKHISIRNTSATINLTLCLNGIGAQSCQDFNILVRDKKYTIGGTLSGLTANGLVLLNNGRDNLNVPAGATQFTFSTPITEGSSYNVTVGRQPTNQVCTVSNGTGTNVNANVTNISIVCSTTSYTIGGSISGLGASTGLILKNNGTDDLPIPPGSTQFQFPQRVAAGGGYHVTVGRQPTGKTCTVNNGTGTHVNSNVTNINVVCSVNSYTIGGSISGLGASPGLILKNNGTDDLPITPGSTQFQFPQRVAAGGGYHVTVGRQPTGKTCTVNNGTGTHVNSNVTNITVVCSVNSYTIGGTISGLSSSGLILKNNGTDDLPIQANATSFQFLQKVAFGGNYNVTVGRQPTGQTCSVTNGNGINVTANVTNIVVTCSVNFYTIGGTISGLSSSGLILQNNATDDLSINSGQTSFVFQNKVAAGGSYSVTVARQPTGQTCTVSYGSGTNVQSNVTDVQVICSVNDYPIGGSVTGLITNGLTLTNNGEDVAIPSGATQYSFPNDIAYGGSYNVTIRRQPQGATCHLSQPSSGTNVQTAITVNVSCTSSPVTINVSILGLTQYGLILQTNGISRSFSAYPSPPSFSYTVPPASNYSVTVLQQPLNQTCVVTNGAGAANPPGPYNVTVSCATSTAYIPNWADNVPGIELGIYLGAVSNTGVITTNAQEMVGNAIQGLAFATFNGVEYAYVLNDTASSLLQCDVNITNCTTAASNVPTSLSSIFFTTVNNQQYAYLGAVTKCTFNANGNTAVCNPLTLPYTPSNNASPSTITLQIVGGNQYLYISYFSSQGASTPGQLFRCKINATGDLEQCVQTPSNPPPLWSPMNISFATINGMLSAYVLNTGSPGDPVTNNTVLQFALNPDGTLANNPNLSFTAGDNSQSVLTFVNTGGTWYSYIADSEPVQPTTSISVLYCLADPKGIFSNCNATATNDPSGQPFAPTSIAFR